MSRLTAFNLLGRIGAEPALLAPSYASGLGATIREMMATPSMVTPTGALDELTQAHLRSVCGSWGADFDERKPYGFMNGVAIIPVHGTLINRFNSSWGFITGYQYIETAIVAAAGDAMVKGIVLDVDSYGGEAQGCFETCDVIHNARKSKPITAIVNANAYSAAYAVSSAANRIVVTPSGGAGSIGVVTMHVDYSAALKEDGIKVTFIYAGKHKTDGNPYEPLTAGVKTEIQGRINATYDEFVAQVVRNRGLETDAVKGTEARIYRAEDAKALGLIDAVEAAPAALRAFVTELSGSQQKDMMTMSTTTEQPAAVKNETPAVTASTPVENTVAATPVENTGTGEGAKAERERIASILNCEEAGDRSALANHLALSTDLTVEQARGVLAASPKEAKPAAATASPFVAAMDGGNHPNVGASADGDEGNDKPADRVAHMLSALSKATGQKFDNPSKH